MNFQTINKQRKFILIAALAGIISVFLPWLTISAGPFGSESINGFHGIGIGVFLAFLALFAMALIGDHLQSLDKTIWLVTMGISLLALLLVIIAMTSGKSGGFGFFEAKNGFGIWISLAATLCILAFAWLYKKPEDNFKSSFESLKKDIPFKMASGIDGTSRDKPVHPVNKIVELEKLIDLKNKGHITEEEYNHMKAKLL